MHRLLVLSLLFSFGVLGAQAQDDGLTARDAFWSASDLVTVAANPAAKTAATASASSASKATKTVSARKQKTATEASGANAGDDQANAAAQIDPQMVTSSGYGSQPHLMRVSTESAQPLGLRYTLLQQRSGGEYAEVFPETVFHSGDKVKISVMANRPGYLYIIEQGSSGSWVPLFPARDATAESNRVAAGRVYLVPSASDESFQFNQQPGKERLFIMLSREPIADLDEVIFGLQHKATKSAASAAASDTPPAAVALVADNRISDELVQRLQSRDLTLVKETSQQETKDAEFGEKAIYVVSQGTGKNAATRVSSDLVLDHQ